MSELQSDVTISGRSITGTLSYIDSGELVTAFGAGNFIALKFTLPSGYESTAVKVGIDPTEGTGLVPLDEDMNAVIKVTDKDEQKIVVIAGEGIDIYQRRYDLSGLTCEAE